MKRFHAVSLFSSGGIGDLALRSAGIETIVANELLRDRAEIFRANYPAAEMIVGDITTNIEAIVNTSRRLLKGATLDFLFATPPCQGMSKNGRGKLLRGIREGQKPALDSRNQLIIPTLAIVKALRPRIFVIENVPEMAQTIIQNPEGEYVDLLEYAKEVLAPEGYIGSWKVVEFADYGVPQRRQRLITVFARNPVLQDTIRDQRWLPRPTHSRYPGLLEKKWVAITDAIGHLPPLDAKGAATATSSIPLHRVPILDEDKYFWVSHTPAGGGAFDNQCANPSCLFDKNPSHGNARDKHGINQSRKDTPIRCIKCGSLLPRPWVKRQNEFTLMSGFTSAYKRMRGDLPASALTRNLSYACSDQKLHPSQNRVLSLLEASIIHTVAEYDFAWRRSDRRPVPDRLIREVIGESIPPKGLEVLFVQLCQMLTQSEREAA